MGPCVATSGRASARCWVVVGRADAGVCWPAHEPSRTNPRSFPVDSYDAARARLCAARHSCRRPTYCGPGWQAASANEQAWRLWAGEQTRHTARAKRARQVEPPACGDPTFYRTGLSTMIRLKPRQMPKPPSLPQQQSDFTAEGAPPLGQVAVAHPAVPKKAGALPPAPTPRKGPVARSRWQR